MTYRSETTGIELHRQRFEEAKATLEEYVNNGVNFMVCGPLDEQRGEYALNTLGFRKEKLPERRKEVYVRENAGGIEILADRDLTKDDYARTPGNEIVFHLYQIPAGQNVQGWYGSYKGSYKYTEPRKRLDSFKMLGSMFGGLSGMGVGSVASGMIEKYGAGETLTYGTMLIVSLVGIVVGCKIGGSFNELTAKGPAALRNIKNNSTYQAPQLRIESKPRIIDAEFTDDTDQGTYQEQVREDLAVTEEQRAKI